MLNDTKSRTMRKRTTPTPPSFLLQHSQTGCSCTQDSPPFLTWCARLDECRLHLALVASVALEAVAEARVVVALATAATLVVVVIGRRRLGDKRKVGEIFVVVVVATPRLDVDARELGRAAVTALVCVDHEQVLRAYD